MDEAAIQRSSELFLETIHSRWSPETCNILCRSARDEQSRAGVLDDDIAKLEALGEHLTTHLRILCAKLRRERNARSHVHRLPGDIMRTIYDFAISALRHRESSPFHALVVSHVCSTWRNIALEHPQMWSFIDLTKLSKACTTLYVQRSQRYPLTILGCTASEDDIAWMSGLLAQNLFRTRCLDVSALVFHDGAWLKKCTAPLLEELRLHSVSDMPTSLCTQDLSTPRLCRLFVAGTGIRMASPMPRRLTTLHIHDVRSPTTLEHADSCVSILRELPDLVNLRLSLGARADNLPEFISSPHLINTAPLPSLRSLTLLVPSATFAARLLSSLILPAALRRFTLSILDPGSISHVLRPEVIPPEIVSSLVVSQLVIYSSREVVLSNGPCHPPETDAEPYFRLMWTPQEVFPLAMQHALVQLRQFYPLPLLTTLVFSGSPYDREHDLVEKWRGEELLLLIQHTSTIEELHLTSMSDLRICELLHCQLTIAATESTRMEGAAGPRLWPNLRRISLRYLTLDARDIDRVSGLCNHMCAHGHIATLPRSTTLDFSRCRMMDVTPDLEDTRAAFIRLREEASGLSISSHAFNVACFGVNDRYRSVRDVLSEQGIYVWDETEMRRMSYEL